MAQAHDPVGHREPQAPVAEGLGDGERHHQQGDHHQQHHDPDGPLLGVDEAGQPGEAHPRPPHDGQRHDAVQEPAPRQVVGHEGGALGEGDDEDEIEEELERFDAAAFAELGAQVGPVLGGPTLTSPREDLDPQLPPHPPPDHGASM